MPYRRVTGKRFRQSLKRLVEKLMGQLRDEPQERTITTKAGKIRYQEFYPAHAKPIIDAIGRVLAAHHGFTEEELDLILNYDRKCRTGADREGEQE
jgi:hypothetical protein